jgi:hypothetical protein
MTVKINIVFFLVITTNSLKKVNYTLKIYVEGSFETLVTTNNMVP